MSIFTSKATGSTTFRVLSAENDWSQPETGVLDLDDDKLSFNEWTIPYASINSAVLNTEILNKKSSQTLVVENSLGIYQFLLWQPFPESLTLPFECNKNANNTAIGDHFRKERKRNKFLKYYYIFAAIMILIQVLISFVKS